MQTRKNRKNDEASYEKMLKLRRDLSRAIILLVIDNSIFAKKIVNETAVLLDEYCHLTLYWDLVELFPPFSQASHIYSCWPYVHVGHTDSTARIFCNTPLFASPVTSQKNI